MPNNRQWPKPIAWTIPINRQSPKTIADTKVCWNRNYPGCDFLCMHVMRILKHKERKKRTRRQVIEGGVVEVGALRGQVGASGDRWGRQTKGSKSIYQVYVYVSAAVSSLEKSSIVDERTLILGLGYSDHGRNTGAVRKISEWSLHDK